MNGTHDIAMDGTAVFPPDAPRTVKGRGALTNVPGRHERTVRIGVDDGWRTTPDDPDDAGGHRTRWRDDATRTTITTNDSPDLHFDASVNPYRGCEHGCIYCFARPGHAWLGHSPGLDFERLLYAKTAAPALLREAFAKRAYRPEPIGLGVVTDAWQPLERELRITRALLEVFVECRHPVLVITKASLIERDVDLLAELASRELVTATITITTLDPVSRAGWSPVRRPPPDACARSRRSRRPASRRGCPCRR